MAANAARLPKGQGVIDIMARAKFGQIQALLLLGGSVSAQLPDSEGMVREALMSVNFMVSTASAMEDPDVMYADLVLPRASWYEREAHYISSERKVARSLPSLDPLPESRTDMEFLSMLGSQFVAGPDFDFPSSTVALDELRIASEGAPADMSSLVLGQDLTDARGMQWPVKDELSASAKGNPRRHMGQDGRVPGFPTPTGKALTLPQEHPGLRRPQDPEFPMTAIMSIGDVTWWDGLHYTPHGGDVVRPRQVDAAYVEVGAEDAVELGLEEGSMALVTSGSRSVVLPVRLAPTGMAKGHVFIPWGGDIEVQALAPSAPLDGDGVPPWSTFPVKLEVAPFS
jgi:assimilatory nitrate reductase catalytic subunit